MILLGWILSFSCFCWGFSSLQELNKARWSFIERQDGYENIKGLSSFNVVKKGAWPRKILWRNIKNFEELSQTMVFLFDSSRKFAAELMDSSKNFSQEERYIFEKDLSLLFQTSLYEMDIREWWGPLYENDFNSLILMNGARKRLWETFQTILIKNITSDDLVQMRFDNLVTCEKYGKLPIDLKFLLVKLMREEGKSSSEHAKFEIIFGNDPPLAIRAIIDMFERGVNFDRNLLQTDLSDAVVAIIKADIEVQKRFLRFIKDLTPYHHSIASEFGKIGSIYERLFGEKSQSSSAFKISEISVFSAFLSFLILF